MFVFDRVAVDTRIRACSYSYSYSYIIYVLVHAVSYYAFQRVPFSVFATSRRELTRTAVLSFSLVHVDTRRDVAYEYFPYVMSRQVPNHPTTLYVASATRIVLPARAVRSSGSLVKVEPQPILGVPTRRYHRSYS